jgi:hypothetical protein
MIYRYLHVITLIVLYRYSGGIARRDVRTTLTVMPLDDRIKFATVRAFRKIVFHFKIFSSHILLARDSDQMFLRWR